MHRKPILIISILISLALIFSGCSSNTATAPSTSNSGMAATPDVTWRFQVVHNPEQLDYKMFQEVCDDPVFDT